MNLCNLGYVRLLFLRRFSIGVAGVTRVPSIGFIDNDFPRLIWRLPFRTNPA
jgi:hypothetical protein